MKYTLGKEDLKSIGRGALIAVAGALLTYLSAVVSNTDFGFYTPLVVAFFGIVANILKKSLDGEVK